MRALTALDEQRLSEALSLAERAVGVSDPNPRVGCIIGRDDGAVLGNGHTQRAGDAHAEVMALRDARAGGHDVRDATAWVTLEPCAHYGRTPPCCDAIVAAGLRRVVVAAADPFPAVAGAGISRMRAAGIDVIVASDAISKRAREINIGFFSRYERGTPWVRLKVAASLDGRTALDNGVSQWITSEAARADGHAWRKRASAIVTGIGTVLADDPSLDVRHVPTLCQPLRVVVDTHFNTPSRARVLACASGGRALVVGSDASSTSIARLRKLPGIDIEVLPRRDSGVDLVALLALLGRREINEVHVEAGPRLNAAFLRAGLVDELLTYVAPKLVGSGRPIAELGPFETLAEAIDLDFVDVRTIGIDLRILARPRRTRAVE